MHSLPFLTQVSLPSHVHVLDVDDERVSSRSQPSSFLLRPLSVHSHDVNANRVPTEPLLSHANCGPLIGIRGSDISSTRPVPAEKWTGHSNCTYSYLPGVLPKTALKSYMKNSEPSICAKGEVNPHHEQQRRVSSPFRLKQETGDLPDIPFVGMKDTRYWVPSHIHSIDNIHLDSGLIRRYRFQSEIPRVSSTGFHQQRRGVVVGFQRCLGTPLTAIEVVRYVLNGNRRPLAVSERNAAPRFVFSGEMVHNRILPRPLNNYSFVTLSSHLLSLSISTSQEVILVVSRTPSSVRSQPQ